MRLSGALEALLLEGSRDILGRGLSGREVDAFTKYLTLIDRWQRVHRLVGSVEPLWLVENVLLDSLRFLQVLPATVQSIADLGSGAGLPGIPIKIVRPDLNVALIESRERRVSFLSTVIREIGLQDCRVVAGRAEAAAEESGDSYDAVVMRCAGDLTALVPVAVRLTRPGGVVIASGPPKTAGDQSQSLQLEWVDVPGALRARRFAIYRKL